MLELLLRVNLLFSFCLAFNACWSCLVITKVKFKFSVKTTRREGFTLNPLPLNASATQTFFGELWEGTELTENTLFEVSAANIVATISTSWTPGCMRKLELQLWNPWIDTIKTTKIAGRKPSLGNGLCSGSSLGNVVKAAEHAPDKWPNINDLK